jgi:hypothetical protein
MGNTVAEEYFFNKVGIYMGLTRTSNLELITLPN